MDTGKGRNVKLLMSGYIISHILLFFSFKYAGEDFPIALVWWYTLSDNAGCRDKVTGMWLIECEFRGEEPHLVVVHVGSIYCAVHLIPFFRKEWVPQGFSHNNTLDKYTKFYVNRFADHHSFEIL